MSPRRYFLKVIIFSLPLLALFHLFGWWITQLPSELSTKKNFFEHKLGEIDTIILGQNDAYHGIHASSLTNHTFNLALPGQSLIMDAQLIQKYRPKLSNLRTVVFTISPTAYTSTIDRQAGSLKSFLYHHHFGVSERDLDWKPAAGLNMFGFLRNDSAARLVMDGISQRISSPAMDEWGSTQTDASTAQESPMTSAKFSRANWNSIEGAIKSLQKQKVQVVFVSLPSKEKQTDQTLRITYGLSQKYDIRYFNYATDTRFAASDLTPEGILSRAGRDKMTQILKTDLSEYLSERPAEATKPSEKTTLNIWTPDLRYFPSSNQKASS